MSEYSHMTIEPEHRLAARKSPRQARSVATLEVIFEATIQVLMAVGPRRLTTTRVAERAGVSVGTMYQYFPHKQALFYALNERYLNTLAQKIEQTCQEAQGTPVLNMIEKLVTTYWQVKTEKPEVTRALYRSVADLDITLLFETFSQRVDAATLTMLSSASDANFSELQTVNLSLLTVIFGTVRNIFERNLTLPESGVVHQQLILMCAAYIDRIRITS